MSGSCLRLQEPDLSHLQHLLGTGVWHEDIVAPRNSVPFPRSFLLPWMLFASLVIHVLLFLAVNPVEKKLVSDQQHTLQIELKRIIQQPKTEFVESVEKPFIEKSEKSLSENKNIPEIAVKNEQINPVEKPKVTNLIIPLTPEELKSWQDQSEPTHEFIDRGWETRKQTAYGDVFDPRLRAKLQAAQDTGNARKPAERVQANVHGMKVFKLTDRHCLMTVPGFRQENANDWYHTSCKDKTESEQMMDRINESLRHK